MQHLPIYRQALARLPGPMTRKEEAVATRDELVAANLAFAFSIALEYSNRGMPVEDLVQYASLGLIEAAERFDPSRGVKFITYAVWWIRQVLQRAVEDPGIIHLPRNKYANGMRLYTETLDEPAYEVDAGEAPQRKDLVADEGPPSDLAVEEAEACAFVSAQLERLAAVEREILRLFFGLDCREHTLAEIGRQVGLSKERIRQKKEAALGSCGREQSSNELS